MAAIHARAQIRAASQLALKGLALTSDRVLQGRTRALPQDHDPTLLVYSGDETSEVISMGNPPTYQRALRMFVDGRVSASTPPDDDLDEISSQVEERLGAHPDLGGIAKAIRLVSTKITTRSDGARHLGEVRLEFEVIYWTREGSPDSAV